MVRAVFIILAFLVAAELLIHMIYHYKTGKAGLYNPPFAYLKELIGKKNKETTFKKEVSDIPSLDFRVNRVVDPETGAIIINVPFYPVYLDDWHETNKEVR